MQRWLLIVFIILALLGLEKLTYNEAQHVFCSIAIVLCMVLYLRKG